MSGQAHPLVRLKSVATLKGGAGFPHDDQGNETAAIPFYKVKDLVSADSDGYLTRTDNYVDAATARRLRAYVFPRDTVLMAKVGAALLLHRFARASGPCCIDNNMLGAVPRKSVLYPNYFRYSMQTVRFDDVVNPGAIPSLGAEAIGEKRVPLPGLERQRAIADFLDEKTAAIDALIEKKERLIALLAEKRAALIHQAVTKGLDPTVPMKPSGIPWIGDIPEHWNVKRMKFVCRLESGHTPSRSHPEYWVPEECVIPWVSLNDTKTLARNDYIEETTFAISEKGMANSSAHLLDAGAVVFTRDATIGLTAITTRPMAVSQHIIAWVCGPSLDNRYLLRVINVMTQELDRLTFGATIKTIGMGDVRELVTPLPPRREQEAIFAHLEGQLVKLDSASASTNKQVLLLQEYRQALITAAVTGQLDIPGAAA